MDISTTGYQLILGSLVGVYIITIAYYAVRTHELEGRIIELRAARNALKRLAYKNGWKP